MKNKTELLIEEIAANETLIKSMRDQLTKALEDNVRLYEENKKLRKENG